MGDRTRGRPARWLLSATLVANLVTQVGFTWLGWTGDHVFASTWHPHARFHAVQLSVLVIGLSLGGCWLLWRRSAEPAVAPATVAVGQVLFWGAEYVALLVPGTSPDPVVGRPNTFSLLGWEVHGNLFAAAVIIGLSIAGGLLAGVRDRRSIERA